MEIRKICVLGAGVMGHAVPRQSRWGCGEGLGIVLSSHPFLRDCFVANASRNDETERRTCRLPKTIKRQRCHQSTGRVQYLEIRALGD